MEEGTTKGGGVMRESMITPARHDCLEQIKRAGFALLNPCGWSVNGWRGTGPNRLGPSRSMIASLVEGAFLGYMAESPNKYCHAVALTAFGEAVLMSDVGKKPAKKAGKGKR